MVLRSNNESGLVVVSASKKLIFFRSKIVISCDAGLVQCAGKGHAEARQLNMPPCFCSDASPWVAPTQTLLSTVVSKGFVCKVLPRGILSLCLVITDAVSRRLFTETLSKQAAKVKLLELRVPLYRTATAALTQNYDAPSLCN